MTFLYTNPDLVDEVIALTWQMGDDIDQLREGDPRLIMMHEELIAVVGFIQDDIDILDVYENLKARRVLTLFSPRAEQLWKHFCHKLAAEVHLPCIYGTDIHSEVKEIIVKTAKPKRVYQPITEE